MENLPKLALSIMQPWSWLIVNGHKDIENRDWPTKFRGPIAIHTGKRGDESAALDLFNGVHPVTYAPFNIAMTPDFRHSGGIVGVAEIVDCVERSDSEWFVGKFGFVIRNARPVEFIPVKGALGFFDWRPNIIVPKASEPARQGSMF